MTKPSPAKQHRSPPNDRPWVWPLIAFAALLAAFAARQAEDRRAIAGVAPLVPPALQDARRSLDPLRTRAGGSWRKARRRGWMDLIRRVYQRIADNRLLTVAAGAVFFCLLALFPALAALVSVYGAFADAATIDAHLSTLSGILPDGAVQILHEALARLTAKGASGLSVDFVIGLVVALWSANSGTKAIFDALNAAYGEKEDRSFVTLNLTSLAFTTAGLIFILAAVATVVVAPIALGRLGFHGVSDTLIGEARWPAILILVIIGLEALYRYGPSRGQARWRWVSVGSATAAAIWLAGSALFSWYIANFGSYNATYGSLGAAIGMMMWMWLSMIVVLLGAELNAELESADEP